MATNNPPPASSRHFMSIGASNAARPPVPRFHLLSTGNQSASGSFVMPQREKPIEKFPDIYTTCPELRKMRDSFISVGMPVVTKFDEPTSSLNATPIQNYPAQPMSSPTTVMQFDPNAPIINPQELHFVPKREWGAQIYSLNSLRSLFFMKRNGFGRLFPFKLYHALLITKAFPDAYQYTGVKWLSENIMKVNGTVFAQLLGIHSVPGGLFHKQGNFSRHQFEQVFTKDHPELSGNPDIADVDDLTIMLFVDLKQRFSRDREFDLSMTDSNDGGPIDA